MNPEPRFAQDVLGERALPRDEDEIITAPSGWRWRRVEGRVRPAQVRVGRRRRYMVPRKSSGIYASALAALGRHKYFRTISEAGKGGRWPEIGTVQQ